MRPVNIEIVNWMCFAGVTRLDLPAGPIALVARYDGDPRRSNWSGKTAFLEAFDWCLFGRHRKRLEDDVITHGRDRARVALTFDDGTVVERERRRGNGYTFRVTMGGDVFEKAAGVEALERRLRMSWDDLIVTTRFVQGDTEALVGNVSGHRQAVLRRWFELDSFDRMAAAARREAKEIGERARAADGNVTRITARLADMPSKADLQAAVDAHRRDAALLQEQAENAREQLETAVEAVNRARDLGKRSSRLRMLRSHGARLKPIAATLGVKKREERALLQPYAKAEAEVVALERERAELADLAGGRWDRQCPVLCASCPVADAVESDLEAIRDRAERFEERYAAAREVSRAALEKLNAAKAAREEAESAAVNVRATAQEVRGLLDDGVTETPPDPTEAEQAVRDARERWGALNEKALEAQRALRDAERDLADRDELVAEKVAAEQEAAKLLTRTAAARLATRALGPGGVPREIAAVRVRQLETRVNALLVGTGLAVTLSWQRPTQTKAEVCDSCGVRFPRKGAAKECAECGEPRGWKMADELEILVDDGSGEVEDVRAKSGGARVMVGSAFRLAGGALLRGLRGSPVAWASVDEALGPLDGPNRDRMVTALAWQLGSVGIEQALIVSHHPGVLDSLPSRIEIRRDEAGGTSRIEQG